LSRPSDLRSSDMPASDMPVPDMPAPDMPAPDMPAVRAGSAPRSFLVAYAQLTASMTLVGVYVALSKPLTAALPVFMLAWLRFALAALAMLPWLLPRRGRPALAPRDHRLVFLQSFFGNFLFSACMLYGVAMSSASAAGIVMSTLPAVVAVGSCVLLRERMQPHTILAVLLAVAGMALLPRAGAAEGGWLGAAFVLGAVGCEALYVIIGKPLASRCEPLRLSAMINAWGLALTTPFAAWQWSAAALQALSPALWALLAFYALAASLFAVWLWMTGLQVVPASQAGVFTIALPIAATLVGVLGLGETFGVRHVVALSLGIASILLVANPRRSGAQP